MSTIFERYKRPWRFFYGAKFDTSWTRVLRVRRLLLFAALGITTALLIVGLLTSIWMWQVKDWGISVDWDGRLLSVQPGSRAAQAGVVPGDYISFKDFQRLNYLSGQSRVGQTVNILVVHNGEQRTVTLEAQESNTSRQLDLGIVTWVGMGFVLLGIAPLIARRRDFTLLMFFLASEIVGLFLMAQRPRTLHLFWAEVATYITLPLFPALLFHFHTRFPQGKFGRWRRPLVALVYTCGVVVFPFNLPGLWDWGYHTSDVQVAITELYLSGALVACLGMLIHTYWTTRDKRVRQQLKIITLCSGTGLAVNPALMILALLPSLNVSNALENLSVVTALLTPFGYAYSMLRYDLLTDGVLWRRWLIRVAISSMLLIGGLGLGVGVLANSRIDAGAAVEVGVLAALGAVLLGVLNTLLGEWAEGRLLKGGSYVDLLDYATRELQHFQKLDQYIHFFVDALPARLKISGALIFLAPGSGSALVLRSASAALRSGIPAVAPTLAVDSALRRVIQAARSPMPLAALFLPTAPAFSREDAALLEILRLARVELLLPLIANQQAGLIGLVAFGMKETDESYLAQELTALTALARTAATSAENVLLFEAQEKQLAALKEERDYRAALARQITTTADRERKQIARDLHDRPLQDIGLTSRALTKMRQEVQTMLVQCEEQMIQIESGRSSADPDPGTKVLATLSAWETRLGMLLGEDTALASPAATLDSTVLLEHHPTVEALISQVDATARLLREICNDLHPTYLDSPLSKTLHAVVAGVQQREPAMGVHMETAGVEPPELRDEVKVACKHILDQALQNALRHAQASQIGVTLSFGENRSLVLAMHDNGRGFTPVPLQARRAEEHHGLANMQERADAVGGQLRIDSALGQGTRVTLSAPV